MDAIIDRTVQLVELAEKRGITLRILGAIAVKKHCPKFSYILDNMEREISDVDLMGYKKQLSEIVKMFEDMDYTLLWGVQSDQRKIFGDPGSDLKVDIFLDGLYMCHDIDFRSRLCIDNPTISLADMLLEKLQIVQIAEKDIKDVLVLLREHDVGKGDKETINSEYVSKLLSSDWGFYHTTTINLDKFKRFVPKYTVLSAEDKENIESKITKLLETIERRPKSSKWKMRSVVGPKTKWYRDVEDVNR